LQCNIPVNLPQTYAKLRGSRLTLWQERFTYRCRTVLKASSRRSGVLRRRHKALALRHRGVLSKVPATGTQGRLAPRIGRGK